jgi:DNA-binding IclR family transcriptional regulator
MTSNTTSSIHKTTERALDLLDFVRRQNGVTVTEIVEQFDLSRSTAHLHLNTLTRHGFLVREHGRYCIGLRFREFSVCARNRHPSYQIIKTKIEEIYAEIEGEIELLVEESGRMNLVYHTESVRHDRVRLYLHNTAAGKAILSELPRKRIDEIIDRWGLPKETSNTITDRETLLDELETVAEQGYAFNDQECFEGYYGIGAAVEGIDGSILGAITIGGPTYRVDENTLKTELPSVLREAVRDVEETIRNQREIITQELSNR